MKAIGEPQNARSRRTRENLLNAARELAEEQGFEAMTLAAVADRAGISHRGLYLHFSSRAELLAALYWHLGEAEGLGVSLAKVWDSPDAAAALREWAHHIARAHPRIQQVAGAVDRARRTDPDAAAYWRQMMENWLKGCTRLARWLADEGRLAPPWTVPAAADMIWSLMSWDLLERLTVERGWKERQVGDHLEVLITRTFLREPPAARG